MGSRRTFGVILNRKERIAMFQALNRTIIQINMGHFHLILSG